MRRVVMRGDLSDALDRLARRDEALRRRAEPEDARSAAEELVAAARRLVDRHPELAVTVTVESGQSRSSVQLVHGQSPRVLEDAAPQEEAPTAGVRPLELAPDEVVVLDNAPQPPTAAARLAELLREYPPDY
ncbi:MAG: hypothetical protein V7603_2543 [Micromonosporaceae bacterium]